MSGQRSTPRAVGKVRSHGEFVSGIGGMAESNATDLGGIQAVAGLSSRGDVCAHEPDAAIGSFDTTQYFGGALPPEHNRVQAVSGYCKKLQLRTSNSA